MKYKYQIYLIIVSIRLSDVNPISSKLRISQPTLATLRVKEFTHIPRPVEENTN